MKTCKKQAAGMKRTRLLLKDLGWSKARIEEARSRLASFEQDWDHPGMEKYDLI